MATPEKAAVTDWTKDIIPLTGKDAVGEKTARSDAKGRVMGAVVELDGKGKASSVIVFRQGDTPRAYPELGFTEPTRAGKVFKELKERIIAGDVPNMRVYDDAHKGTTHALVLAYPDKVTLDGTSAKASAPAYPTFSFLKK